MPISTSHFVKTLSASPRLTLFVLGTLILSGCTAPGYTVQSRPANARPLPSTLLYFYPTRNQSKEQQERDRYECYLWAAKQSGYDPGQEQLAPHQRVEVRPAAPPGSDVATGMASGAVLGSIFSPRHNHGQGMVFGAIAGAIIGSASEAAKQDQAQQIQQHYDAMDNQQYARKETQARNYRRAMSACLEGRGYTVR